LIGPYRLQGARSQASARTDDNRCPLEGMRRGTSSACAKRMHSSPGTPNKRSPDRGHVLRSVQRPVQESSTFFAAKAAGDTRGESRGRRSLDIRYRGRANPRKWKEPAPGVGRRKLARLAARHCSRKRAHVTRQKRKVVMAIVPARNREPRAQCPYVVVTLQCTLSYRKMKTAKADEKEGD
jgi:hypothetical protein